VVAGEIALEPVVAGVRRPGRPAPERERLVREALRVARVLGGRRGGHEILEAHRVDGIPRQLQTVPAGGRGDDVDRQLGAQPRHERLQRGARVLGEVVGPDVLGDRAVAEVGAGVEREAEQQGPLPVAGDLDRAPVVLDLPRPEHPNPHATTLRALRRISSPDAAQRPRTAHSTASALMGLTRVARRVGAMVATRVSTAAATTTIAMIAHGTPGATMPGTPRNDPSIDWAPAQP